MMTKSFRTALVELLRSLGYEAQSFASARKNLSIGAGRDRAIASSPTLNMPRNERGLTSFSYSPLAARRCRVIMVTGRSEPGLEAKAAAGGGCLPADEAVRR